MIRPSDTEQNKAQDRATEDPPRIAPVACGVARPAWSVMIPTIAATRRARGRPRARRSVRTTAAAAARKVRCATFARPRTIQAMVRDQQFVRKPRSVACINHPAENSRRSWRLAAKWKPKISGLQIDDFRLRGDGWIPAMAGVPGAGNERRSRERSAFSFGKHYYAAGLLLHLQHRRHRRRSWRIWARPRPTLRPQSGFVSFPPTSTAMPAPLHAACGGCARPISRVRSRLWCASSPR